MTASNKPQGFKNLEVFSISNKTCRGRGIKRVVKRKIVFIPDGTKIEATRLFRILHLF